jgi:tryptophan synthase alpha chain
MNEHILTERIRAAGAEGRPAVIPFLTAGFPDLERFWTALDELDEGGADIIEVGVPFSDPVADGPVVEAASHHALAEGVTLARLLQGLREREAKRRASGSERQGAPWC